MELRPMTAADPTPTPEQPTAPRTAAWLRDQTGTSDEADAIRIIDGWLKRLDSIERFAIHDPGVEWPGKTYSTPEAAIMGALDGIREAAASVPAPEQEEAVRALNAAYAERNSLVAALARLFANAAWRGIDPDAPEFTVVYIDLPTGQVSWHVPDSEMEQFPPLPLRDPTGWDGHDTPEKYRRLAALRRGDICRDVQEAVERTARAALATPPPVPAAPGLDEGLLAAVMLERGLSMQHVHGVIDTYRARLSPDQEEAT